MENLPQHIALIPDGNRRWARARRLSPWEGHREGVKRFREISEAAWDMKIPFFTFWAGSEENLLERSRVEVGVLVSLMKQELKRHLASREMAEKEIRFRLIGRWREILKDKALNDLAEKLEEKTKSFVKHHLTILFGYDGRREMTEAIEKIKNQNSPPRRIHGLRPSKAKQFDFDSKIKIGYEDVKNALWTHELPPVDLVVRTGGEPHWSAGFMMWYTAYSQLHFTEKFWPDFDEKEFKKALADYASRERRFGK